ncbi:MAG: conjugal transfer protein TraX [Oscillospiraceae bacterium]|nr:conjugal transfer protein TraX [Oscillospiraceae bacterium]
MTSFTLKWIAMLSMLIDHIGFALVPGGTPAYYVCRAIGRMAFPLFAFMLAEGFFYTKDVRKYLLRLSAFAVASELPFDWLLYGSLSDMRRQNVLLTLVIALLGMWMFDGFAARGMKWAALLSMLAAGAAGVLTSADYGAFGVLLVFIFYRYRGERRVMAAWFSVAVLLYSAMTALPAPPAGRVAAADALLMSFALFALAPILLYNRSRGYDSRFLRYFFYVFYPAHMALLCAIRDFIV